MRNIVSALIATCLLPLTIVRAAKAETLDQLLSRISKVPDDSSGLGKTEQEYIRELLKHEDEAIPRLVAMLSHPDKSVAEIAAAALGDCKHIDSKYLPQIIAGLDRDIGWLPRALGRMDSDDAAKEAVARYLAADTSPQNQEAYAVELQGARAIPFLIEAAKANGGKDPDVYYLLGHALGEMDAAARTKAAPALVAVLKDEQSSVELSRGILRMIYYLGEAGLILEPNLLDLRTSRPALREQIDSALIGVRSTRAGEIFSDILKKNTDPLLLRDIAQVGRPARDAGPEVAKLLNHSDWNIRRAAARTLGFIGYELATPQLIELLNDPSDVKMNWIAAQSLGRLYAKPAEDSLTATAEKHWHPAVRKEAETALSHVRSLQPYESKYRASNFPLEYFTYDDFETKTTSPERDVRGIKEPLASKMYRSSAPKQIEKLSYSSEIVGYGANDEAEQKEQKGEGGIIEVNQENIVEHRQPIKQIPNVALRVEGGWLAGSDRGEWGGELVFIADKGDRQSVISENIHDLYTLGKRRIAVAGLAHLMSNDGMIYELTIEANSKWKATPWRALPGAPRVSAKTKSGEILISTYNGGDVVLSEDGSFRMASDAEPDDTSSPGSGENRKSGH